MKLTLVASMLPKFTGAANLYRLSEPYEYAPGEMCDHVVVSATNVFFDGPETYVFPADKDGTVLSWGELSGSYSGGLDHSVAVSGFEAAAPRA